MSGSLFNIYDKKLTNNLIMKKIISIITLLILTASPLRAKSMRILVHPFENTGSNKYSWISAGMTDTVISDLNRIRHISAVSDKDRRKAIEEISLGQTGLINEKTAVKVGEMTGANLIFTGSYSVHGDRIRVIAKLMRVSTGDIEKSVKIDGSLKLLFDVQDKIIVKLMTETEKISIAYIEPVKFEDVDIKRIYQKKRPDRRAYVFYSKGLSIHHTNPHKALSYYLKAVKIDPDYWEALYRTGWLYCDLNRFSESLRYLTRAKSLLEISDGQQNTSEYAETIKYFGIVYEYKGQYDKALEYYSRAKVIQDNLGLQNTSSYADTIACFGAAYSRKGLYVKALEYYSRAKVIQENLGRQNTSGYADTISSIGSVYHLKGEYDVALEYYSRAKKVRDNLGLQNTSEYAITINNIGSAYYSKGDNNMALEHFFNAKRIRDQLGLQNTSEYAIIMHNIGELYYKKLNKPCEGAKYMRKCVEIEERLGHKDAGSDRKYLKKIESDCRK